MNELLLATSPPTDPFMWRRAIVAMLLAFALGQVIAGVYMATFRGLSYARTTVHSMALGSVVTCMVMIAVSNSIAAGIGVAAGLTAIRFRTTLRDPRDIIFVFAALGTGMACGAQAYGAAIVGTVVFSLGGALLHVTNYGARHQSDGLLRFIAPVGPESEESVAKLLRAHCRSFSLVTLRETAQGRAMEHAYQISARSPDDRAQLVQNLQSVPGLQDVTLLLQEPTLEL